MSITPSPDEINRRILVTLKRRLALSGYAGDLSSISDITVLRQLLNQRVVYKEDQKVEVEFENPHIWREGIFTGYRRYKEEDFDHLMVSLDESSPSYGYAPERVRLIEGDNVTLPSYNKKTFHVRIRITPDLLHRINLVKDNDIPLAAWARRAFEEKITREMEKGVLP